MKNPNYKIEYEHEGLDGAGNRLDARAKERGRRGGRHARRLVRRQWHPDPSISIRAKPCSSISSRPARRIQSRWPVSPLPSASSSSASGANSRRGSSTRCRRRSRRRPGRSSRPRPGARTSPTASAGRSSTTPRRPLACGLRGWVRCRGSWHSRTLPAGRPGSFRPRSGQAATRSPRMGPSSSPATRPMRSSRT